MKIKSISYGRTFNDGNYETSRIDMTADVDPDESVEDVFEALVDSVFEARKIELKISRG